MNLNQVTVPSSDVPTSIPFYEKLGFKLIVHTHEKYARFECPDGDATLSLHYANNISEGAKPIIYFECDDLDQKVDAFIGKGITIAEMPNDKPWLWREAHIYDPDGNHLILFKAGDNRKNPPWRKKD